jgi:hypothetical protein
MRFGYFLQSGLIMVGQSGGILVLFSSDLLC